MGIFDRLFGKNKKQDVNNLINVLLYDRDWKVRRDAAEALGKIGDARAVEPLIQALKDKKEVVQIAAKKALGKIKVKES